MSWTENSGNTEFGGQYSITEYKCRRICTGDFNNDGNLDIVAVTNYIDDSIVVFLNQGGNFDGSNPIFVAEPGPTYGGYDLIRSVDLDGDGDQDILCVYSSESRVAWFENLGGMSFSTVQLIESSNYYAYSHLIPVDIDGDGLLDISLRKNNFAGWIPNLGGGSFGGIIPYSGLTGVIAVESEDMDGDGDPDIVFGTTDVMYCENLGGGVFGSPQTICSFVLGGDFKIDDFDGDGLKDVAVATAGITQDIVWAKNLGGLFSGIVDTIYTGSGFGKMNVFDYDNDGDSDIFIGIDDNFVVFKSLFFDPYVAGGSVFYDQNQSGIMEVTETGVLYAPIITNNPEFFALSNSQGKYRLNFQNFAYGSYNVQHATLPYWSISSIPSVYNINYNPLFLPIDTLNFGLYPLAMVDSINVELTGGFPRCNQEVNYWINIRNIGTTIPSGSFSIDLDDSLTFLGSELIPDSIIGNTIYWSYDSLFYFEELSFSIIVLFPDFNSAGDTLNNTINFNTGIGGTYNTSDTLNQVVVCAYDPNDKTVAPQGIDSIGSIPTSTPFLDYTIRFQNTGNDTALTVVLKDYLDDNLEWNSIIPLGSSHEMDFESFYGGEIHFTFNNIMLPDSTTNFLGSQGFVKYRIYLKPGLIAGTTIYNEARIYFDQNPAVVTNKTISTILFEDDAFIFEISQIKNSSIQVFPNPTHDQLKVIYKNVSNIKCQLQLLDSQGRSLQVMKIDSDETLLDMSSYQNGIYYLQFSSASETNVLKVLKY